jgi:hypothetical protein
MNKDYVEGLKNRLLQLDEERSAILKLLEVWGDKDYSPSIPKTSQSFSIGGRIVDAVIELIHKTGRPVRNSEIMDFIKEKQLPLGNTENPERMLSAILSNEIRKRDSRLKKAARGYYEIRQ